MKKSFSAVVFLFLGQFLFAADLPEAATLRAAAEKGDTKAMVELGRAYVGSRLGLEGGVEMAIPWFEKAAEKGDTEGMYWAGTMQLDDKPGSPKVKRAIEWFTKLAITGNTEAMATLAEIYYADDDETSVKWSKLEADAGVVGAFGVVAKAYHEGRGVTKDPAMAVEWYKRGLAQGGTYYMNDLGEAYLAGDGVPKDAKQAVAWFKKGAETGVKGAMFNLGLAYLDGTGVEKDLTKAREWIEKGDEVPWIKERALQRIDTEMKKSAGEKKAK